MTLRGLIYGAVSSKALAALSGLAILLSAYGVWALPPQVAKTTSAEAMGDILLYQDIVSAMRAGQGYYEAATTLQRKAGYPLKPGITVRLPTVAWLLALLPADQWRRATLGALGICAGIWFVAGSRDEGVNRVALLIVLLPGALILISENGIYLHETWAMTFLLASVAARRQLWLSVGFGLAAVLCREVAMPYLAAMLVLAVVDRDRKAALAWLSAILLASAVLAIHSATVAGYALPGDRVSHGWVKAQGWLFVVSTARWSVPFLLAGQLVTAALLPFAFLSLAIWRSRLGIICGMTVAAFAVAFMIVGRPDNHYWGIIYAPFILLGLPALVRRLASLAPRKKALSYT